VATYRQEGEIDMERMNEIEKCMGIDCEVYTNVPDDAIYTVVCNGKKQIINIQSEDWEDDEDLANLLYDRLV
jgi:hypothetical protein